MTANRTDVRLAMSVLVASGAAALGHQILWTRRLIDLLGASAESSARVFECFFLGLALGAAAISLVLAKIRRPWRALAFVELGVALLCLPALVLPEWTAWIWPAVGPERLVSWQGSVLKLLLSVLTIVPPAFLMGMTLPLMTAAVGPVDGHFSTREIWLYAANTLGGVFGLAIVVLFALQIGGATGAMLLMIGFNLAVAATCYRRSLREMACPGVGPPVNAQQERGRDEGRMGMSLVFSFLSGAGVLALEILTLALVNLKAPLAIYPQAVILLCVILVLALSASIAPAVARRWGGVRSVLPIGLAAAGVAIAMVPVVFMNLPGAGVGYFGYGRGFGDFLASLARSTFICLGPAVAFAGTVFPLVIAWCGQESQMPPGQRLGRLLAVNGIGGIIGAETAFRFLLPWFGPHVALGILGACYGLSAIFLPLVLRAKRIGPFLFPFGALLFVCLVTPASLVKFPVFLESNRLKVIEVRSGREGMLAVVENEPLGRAMIFDNQYLLGGSGVSGDLRREAHLPLLLHPAPARVAFIGLGTGITAAGALQHLAVKSITAVELSALVADAAGRHFRQFNDDVTGDSKVQVCVEDARTYLTAAKGRLDVIVGDLFTPWRPGEASLCSLEAFAAAREALRPGGVFCQWIQITQWTPEQFEMAAATFREAFGHLYLFRNHFGTKSAPVGLVGFKSGRLDWGIVARRCDFERQQGRLLDPACRHLEGVAMLYLGQYSFPQRLGEHLVNTLGNLRIELSACRQLVAENPERYFTAGGARWFGFIQQQIAEMQKDTEMTESLRSLPALGLLASKLEAAREANQASATTLEEQLQKEMPRTILTDSAADWSLWPGGRPPRRLPEGRLQ